MENTEQKEQPQKQPTNWKKELLSWVLTIGVPVAIVLFLNAFIGKLVIVDGTSMYPTLYDHDLLVIRSIAYTPEQGDIIVCTTSEDGGLNGKNIVKRCIATEGQTVIVNYEDNTVTVDGEVLDEPYLNTSYGDVMMDDYYSDDTYVVPEGCIFVMGDNRNNSVDSRSIQVGMVSTEDVLGGMVLRIPVGHLIGDNDNP